MEDSNPPISPSINIKDEPIDEGYDAALLPQSSIRQIKEELEHQEVRVWRESESLLLFKCRFVIFILINRRRFNQKIIYLDLSC